MTPDVMPQNQSRCQSPSTPRGALQKPDIYHVHELRKETFPPHIFTALQALHLPSTHCIVPATCQRCRESLVINSLLSRIMSYTRTHTSSYTWSLWKVLNPGRFPYVIMFDFRLYFNHYIIFEICELRLYISPLSIFLVSSSPSFLLSTPVGKYFPSSRWEKAFSFQTFLRRPFLLCHCESALPQRRRQAGGFGARFTLKLLYVYLLS